MKVISSVIIKSACALLLGGCAVSSDLMVSEQTPATSNVVVSSLPLEAPDTASTLSPSSEKFEHPDTQMLVMKESIKSGEISAELGVQAEQAYLQGQGEHLQISTQNADLKPYVGRWTLQASDARSKVKRIGSYLGLSNRCELTLEETHSEYGFKATGNSACPTSLFMLDSWVAFDGRLVLRDHMGDEIIKLRSDGRNIWVGVSKEGKTLTLKKS
ncbi:AprI/Inh family metalloprotease inhibitor [uncultured Cohaesibacter sp.]|uniref:AprI/Inh family metalloprotease inhibitor n=1 Tax=uncultured Cohaesibacter sp. TaxID=1002546 RepID=UPI00292D9E79|nr:AprI/Inh family metalloprotease inhibitor [uncultured Cohaesibacter sp.]